jgi:hypothetical protein
MGSGLAWPYASALRGFLVRPRGCAVPGASSWHLPGHAPRGEGPEASREQTRQAHAAARDASAQGTCWASHDVLCAHTPPTSPEQRTASAQERGWFCLL